MLKLIVISSLILISVTGCTPLDTNACVGKRAMDACDAESAEKGFGLPDYPGC